MTKQKLTSDLIQLGGKTESHTVRDIIYITDAITNLKKKMKFEAGNEVKHDVDDEKSRIIT